MRDKMGWEERERQPVKERDIKKYREIDEIPAQSKRETARDLQTREGCVGKVKKQIL